LLPRARHRLLGGILLGDIGRDRRHATVGRTERFRHGVERARVDVDGDHGGTFGGEAAANRRADAAAGAGDDRDLVGETPHDAPLPVADRTIIGAPAAASKSITACLTLRLTTPAHEAAKNETYDPVRANRTSLCRMSKRLPWA